MYDIAAIGELLVDFTQSGRARNGMRQYTENPGGAVANVLTQAVKLGKSTAFIGKIGRDTQGEFLRDTLCAFGIDTRGLIMTDEAFTTLAFVTLSRQGGRDFAFARKPGADTLITPAELDMQVLSSCRVLHTGSLSLTDEPARSATHAAIKAAKAAGALISYDPNYRAPLWKDEAAARELMRTVLPDVDIVKVADNECELLTGESDPEKAAAALISKGVRLCAVTLGPEGALMAVPGGMRTVPGYKAAVIDSTGAGDCFMGSLLSVFLDSGISIDSITPDDAARFARFANAAASLCVERSGAMPAMPDAMEILVRMDS